MGCSAFTKGVFQTAPVLWLSWLHQAAGEAGKWEEADSGLPGVNLWPGEMSHTNNYTPQ